MAAALAAMSSVTACGSDNLPTALTIETSDPSPDRVSIDAPDAVEAGRVEIELRNRGDMLHDAQLFRVDGRHTGSDIATVLELPDSHPKPRWLHPTGGVAPTKPGETVTVTQALKPGTYFVADTQERLDPNGARITNAVKHGVARIDVRGDAISAATPARTPASITATEDGFKTSGIVAGSNRVTFRNAGDDLHHVLAFPIPPGLSFKAGERRVVERELGMGWVPVAIPHDRSTTVLEPGAAEVTELTFHPGRYVLLCVVASRADHLQQWETGMLSELRVPSAAGR